jgi:hypothetical protein
MMPAGMHITGRRGDGDERDHSGNPQPATLRQHSIFSGKNCP